MSIWELVGGLKKTPTILTRIGGRGYAMHCSFGPTVQKITYKSRKHKNHIKEGSCVYLVEKQGPTILVSIA